MPRITDDQIDEEYFKKYLLTAIMPNGDINTSSFADLDFQNEYTNIFKKQEIPQDSIEEFNDPLFPADYYSLGYIENYDVKWEKVDMILYTNNFKILPPTNEFEGQNYHINSGILTNYYYLNGIYALLKYPSIIYKLFPFYEKSINGLYGINLRVDGIWKMVLIDESFPCSMSAWTVVGRPQRLMKPAAWAWS